MCGRAPFAHNQLAMRSILALVASFLCATAAHVEPVPQSELPDANLGRLFRGWSYPARIGFQSSLDGKCENLSDWRRRNRPAHEADRLLLRSGQIVDKAQVDVDCVLQAYSQDRLQGYAVDGDPLANYALALQRATAGPLPCNNLEELIRPLTVAGDTIPSRALRKKGFVPRRRYPDAIFVKAQIYDACGQEAPKWTAITQAQYDGYTPAYLIEKIEPLKPPAGASPTR